MGDVLFFFIFFNTFVVSALLWLITFLGSYLYNSKNDLNRNVQFECGFYSTNKIIPEYNFNFVISAIFLILYDIEFVLLIPALFNVNYLNNQQFVFFIIFILVIVFSLILDVETGVLKWHYNGDCSSKKSVELWLQRL